MIEDKQSINEFAEKYREFMIGISDILAVIYNQTHDETIQSIPAIN